MDTLWIAKGIQVAATGLSSPLVPGRDFGRQTIVEQANGDTL
jgi:hypothetical protein